MKLAVSTVLTLFAFLTPAGAQPKLHSTPMQVLHGKPFVMAMVNGHGPYRFILDTGTSAEAIVTPELASELQLPQTGNTRLDDPSGGSGQPAPVRRIETLSVAGVDFYAVRAVEHPLLSGDGPCDGMLGFPLFKGLLLTLDYPQGLVTLEEGELDPDGDRTVHSFRMPQGLPVVDIMIGGLRIGAMLDSAGAGLSLPERLVSRLRFSAAPTDFARAESLSSRFSVKVGKLATDVHLGDITFDQPWIEINSAFPQANFGSVPMQHFAITFDQENLLVRLEGPRKRVNLGITPSPVRLTNEPLPQPPDPRLVPVG